MPVQNHRFPLRRQIVWGMRLFTAIVSLAVGLALFWLSNRYVRDNTLQSAEFNLRLITEAIQSSLDSADEDVGILLVATLVTTKCGLEK